MTRDEKIIRNKVGVLELAKQLGSVSQACRIYQQTFVDTYAKVGFDVKTAITAADLLNDRVLPFYDENGIPLCRVLTDRGSEYCGNPERHEYELYLAIEDIDHSRTKTKSPVSGEIPIGPVNQPWLC
jgi:hypothetical protein